MLKMYKVSSAPASLWPLNADAINADRPNRPCSYHVADARLGCADRGELLDHTPFCGCCGLGHDSRGGYLADSPADAVVVGGAAAFGSHGDDSRTDHYTDRATLLCRDHNRGQPRTDNRMVKVAGKPGALGASILD